MFLGFAEVGETQSLLWISITINIVDLNYEHKRPARVGESLISQCQSCTAATTHTWYRDQLARMSSFQNGSARRSSSRQYLDLGYEASRLADR
jgi:hypothetical protein